MQATPVWLPNGDGALACIPRKGKHDSQFWITVASTDELAHLNSRNFVFGQVVKGLGWLTALFEAAENAADHRYKGAYTVIQKNKVVVVDCGECAAPGKDGGSNNDDLSVGSSQGIDD